MSTGQVQNASEVLDRQLAAGRAEKPAYLASEETITYGDLARRVNRAGRLLRELASGGRVAS